MGFEVLRGISALQGRAGRRDVRELEGCMCMCACLVVWSGCLSVLVLPNNSLYCFLHNCFETNLIFPLSSLWNASMAV